jgi:hypothetical protein
MPNECWQSGFTHYPLAGGTDSEILTWLDDHSRYALSVTASPQGHRHRGPGSVPRCGRRPRRPGLTPASIRRPPPFMVTP